MAEQRINWKRASWIPAGFLNPGLGDTVAVVYVGTTEHGVSYQVHAIDSAGRRVFRAFRVAGHRRLPIARADGGPLKTRKAAYGQAEQDLTDVLAERAALGAAGVTDDVAVVTPTGWVVNRKALDHFNDTGRVVTTQSHIAVGQRAVQQLDPLALLGRQAVHV